jgi:hypothetical protein
VVVPTYSPSHNARPDVAAVRCHGSASDGWTLDGVVRNSATKARRYSIAVDFVTTPGSTVMATRVVDVGPVNPNKSARWSTPASGQGQAKLNCVIRQALWS